MRKVNGVKNLIVYLNSINYPMTEEEINDLIQKRTIPHLRPLSTLIVFDLDHIDWWITQQKHNEQA